jgi:hypothetical protein
VVSFSVQSMTFSRLYCPLILGRQILEVLISFQVFSRVAMHKQHWRQRDQERQ